MREGAFGFQFESPVMFLVPVSDVKPAAGIRLWRDVLHEAFQKCQTTLSHLISLRSSVRAGSRATNAPFGLFNSSSKIQQTGARMETSPITYPTVTVGGREFQLRFGLGAWVQLNKQGIGAAQLAKILQSDQRLAMTMQLAAAGLGTFDAEGQWHSLNIDAVELADRLKDGELAQLSEAILPALQAGKGGPAAVASAKPAKNKAA